MATETESELPGHTYTGRTRWIESYAYLPIKIKQKWVWFKPLYLYQVEKMWWSHDDMESHPYWDTAKTTDNVTEYILFSGGKREEAF